MSTEAGDDMVKQLGNVEDLLAQSIDLLILNPKDLGINSGDESRDRGRVPVIIIDSSIDPSLIL